MTKGKLTYYRAAARQLREAAKGPGVFSDEAARYTDAAETISELLTLCARYERTLKTYANKRNWIRIEDHLVARCFMVVGERFPPPGWTRAAKALGIQEENDATHPSSHSRP